MECVFSLKEKTYLSRMRKKQRTSILSMVEKKKAKMVDDVPIRLQVLQSNLPEAVRLNIFEDLQRDTNEKYMAWIRKAIRLPLRVEKGRPMLDLSTELKTAKQILDRSTSGQEEAKREVMRVMCQYKGRSSTSYAIGLEGPPGCGKTHFAKNALAASMGREYVCIQLGGATDASYLLGCTYTYEGSKEGRLAASLIEAQCCNPIIHFDEVDKISKTERGAEVEAALIHLIDPTVQSVRDRYFHGIDIDYSKCTFVFTYNDPQRVNPILLDRIKRIEVRPPTVEQRKEIVTNHILPRLRHKYANSFSLSDAAIESLVRSSDAGEGMRDIEKNVEHVVSSSCLCTALGKGAEEVGLDGSIPIKDGNGCISSEFTAACLLPRKKTPPPTGMYT